MKPIRASDIGTYLYCRRAWWYRYNGQESINQAEMAAGTELHRKHGRQVLVAGFMRTLGFVLLLAACGLLTVFALTNFLGN
jgi:CRISPR/Cas system-associated exonuclease Cas4 (RecB family)